MVSEISNVRPFRGSTPKIAEDVWVDPTAVVIGDVELGAGASIWPHVTLRADIHWIRVGAASNIQDGSVLHVTHDSDYVPGGHPLFIGEQVTVGHNATLHGCRIESFSLIGMGAIVLDGAVIESETILGAGSLVPPGKRLDSGYLWVGSPVKRVRPLKDEEKRYLRYSAENYVKLAGIYRYPQQD
jgi:carbonic anhydrase/acetyltransferase-like protein (isoleucine patch superfamily)